MNTGKETLLLGVARSISDDVKVDWSIQSDDNALRRLQDIDNVARAFRDLREQSIEAPDTQSRCSGSPVMFQWGHLNVLEKLGEGSFGEVFRAWDTLLEREVALKLRRSGPSHSLGGGHRYIKEARSLAQLRHNNVLTIFGADFRGDRIGLWTELIEGRTLEQRLREDGPIGADEAILIGRDLCRALAAIHKTGLVHGDIKAANVIREQGGRLVLADLGSATRITDQEHSQEEVYISPLTTAPEILEGATPDPCADLYSLGVLLYRLLSNSYPVETENLSKLVDQHKRGERRLLRDQRPDLPAGLIRVIERAISPEPESRFSSAGAMECALDEVFQQSDDIGKEPAVAPVVKPRPWLFLTIAVIVIGAGLLLTILVFNDQPMNAQSGDIPAAGVQEEPIASQSVPVSPLEVKAGLFCRRDGKKELLSATDTITPGDQLFMEVQTDEKVHVYVINEDTEGAFFVLFPLPDLDTSNPLAASNTHRLPGRRNGAVQDWQVTTAGGTETFMVIASREPLDHLEADLNDAPAAAHQTSGETTHRVDLTNNVGLTRGVGGIIEAHNAAEGEVFSRLDTLYKQLREQQQNDHDVWVTRFVLANPKMPR